MPDQFRNLMIMLAGPFFASALAIATWGVGYMSMILVLVYMAALVAIRRKF